MEIRNLTWFPKKADRVVIEEVGAGGEDLGSAQVQVRGNKDCAKDNLMELKIAIKDDTQEPNLNMKPDVKLSNNKTIKTVAAAEVKMGSSRVLDLLYEGNSAKPVEGFR